MPRIAVVGAGIVGSSVAFRLAQAGASVTVIDRDRVASGTTAASFAWLNANAKRPHEYFELNRSGMAEHLRLRDELADAPWLHYGGMLTWPSSPQAATELAERVDRLTAWGYTAEWWPGTEVTKHLEPDLAIPDDRTAAFFPHEGWIDAPRLATTLLTLAQASGAQILEATTVTAVEKGAQGAMALRLADGHTLQADAVVNAAGTGAPDVAATFDRELPLAPTTGLLVRVHAEHTPLRRVLRGPRLNARPDRPGRILLHMEEIDQRLRDGENRTCLARELVQRAQDTMPAAGPFDITDITAGTRPIPADGFPVLGAVPSRPGYYEAVTHSGVTLGPLVGRLLTHEILGGAADPLAEPFRADRCHPLQ